MLQHREGSISRVVLLIVLLISLSPVLNADVISLNAGGSGNIIINPDQFIEGFFSCVPYTCSDLGYECDTWSDGCAGTLDCGACGSGYTCTSGTCVADVVTPPTNGAGPGVVTPTVDIEVEPTEINIDMAINTAVDRTINITNLESSTTTVDITQEGLDNMVILGATSLTLAAGETKNLTVRFVAPADPGIYTGTIDIEGVEVSVALNVKTKLVLFDSNIVVLNKDYKVPQGDKLKTQVTLIPLGDKERMDVTLNYVIKDYNDKVYLTKSETLLVEDTVQFKRNFDTGMLPLDKYIIGLELIYSNSVAPSSAHFEVVEKPPTQILSTLVWILIIAILIVAILIILILITRHRRKQKEEAS